MKTRNKETHMKKYRRKENCRGAVCRFQKKYSGYNDQSVTQR